jgi:hypothetical protein
MPLPVGLRRRASLLLRSPLLVASAFIAVVAPLAGPGSAVPNARAADDPPAGAGTECVVKGKGVVDKGVQIFSERKDGTAIAGFATQEIQLEVSDFPADPTAGRAKVRTGKGSGSVRVDGWLDPLKVPLAARADVAVAPGHVWIGRGEHLKLKSTSPGKLQVEATIVATGQKLKGKASCGEVAVGDVKTEEVTIPAGAQKWVLRRTSLDLYDEANGSSVFTLEIPAAETGILLYSTETKSGWIHVLHQGSIVIDAWAKAADLKAFPRGEMLDALATTNMVSIAPAKLKVDGTTKEVKVQKDVSLRLTTADAAKPIGVIEEGAEVIVVDSIAGWSRVFPKNLELIPPDGKDFWAKSDDLGIK